MTAIVMYVSHHRAKSVRYSRLRLTAFRACVGVYLIAYAFLSWYGGYIGHNEGGKDNRDTWFPAYCAEKYISPSGRQKVRLTTTGCFFLPVMLVDQTVIHRTHFE
jgi:hypothetical protein